MDSESDKVIAPCGLDCSACDIFKMLHDPDAAERTLKWYRRKGWIGENDNLDEAIAKKMYCEGCFGSRIIHWSPDCGILQCCVN